MSERTLMCMAKLVSVLLSQFFGMNHLAELAMEAEALLQGQGPIPSWQFASLTLVPFAPQLVLLAGPANNTSQSKHRKVKARVK